MKQTQSIIIKKPCEQPGNIIKSNIAIYLNIRNSTNPQDVLQAIELTKNIADQAELLIEEAIAYRDNLVNQLLGKAEK